MYPTHCIAISCDLTVNLPYVFLTMFVSHSTHVMCATNVYGMQHSKKSWCAGTLNSVRKINVSFDLVKIVSYHLNRTVATVGYPQSMQHPCHVCNVCLTFPN